MGIGVLGYGAEFEGADKRTLAQMGISKTVSLSSTYDHRVIQGAESGLFLAQIHELLCGADGFYRDVFRSLGVPYEAVRWRPDANPPDDHDAQRVKQVHVQTLINMYRVRGHLIADLDPLRWKEPRTHPELDPATYGLTIWDLDREFYTDGLAGHDLMTLGDLLGVLRDAYCRRIGVEYMHIQEPEQKRWIQEQVEGVPTTLDTAEQLYLLGRLNAAEAFERFLHTKYVGHKRFGLEGAESLIPLVDEVLDQAAAAGIQEAVLGMAHRGRLNVLANIIGKPLRKIFREFEGNLDPETTQGSGDVKYHLGAAGKFVGRSGQPLPVTLASNPSHLEAVDPVVEGMVRARQDLIGDPEAFAVLPLVIHGDAAFAGQGVVAETLNLSALRGYRVGGTIHVVVNNQLGFTTAPEEARSSVYATDVAKMVQAPIFHVNGDDPEACLRVARMAFGFRQRFHKDVVIDMVCYRRHGHNEGDDPSFTQPLMYKLIEGRRSVRKLYTETLVRRGDITADEAEKALDDFLARMQTVVRGDPPVGPAARWCPSGRRRWSCSRRSTRACPGPCSTGSPAACTPRPRASPSTPSWPRCWRPATRLYREGQVDWSLGEALAFGSLLLEGVDVRLAGQDTRRGTFSQRHSVLVDSQTGSEHVPLASLRAPGRATGRGRGAVPGLRLAAVGVRRPRLRVRLLRRPHRGAGGLGGPVRRLRQRGPDRDRPVHRRRPSRSGARARAWSCSCPTASRARARSTRRPASSASSPCAPATTSRSSTPPARPSTSTSCAARSAGPAPSRWWCSRPSRCCGPTAPARRSRSWSAAASTRCSTTRPSPPGACRRRPPHREAVRRVVLASGKVALDAIAQRDQRGLPAAVVRVEQLYPWPGLLILDTVSHYPAATEVVWLQEEPREHGRVELRQRPPGPPAARVGVAPPRQPHGVGQPRQRQPHRPPTRAGGAPRADVRRSVRRGSPLDLRADA